MKVYSFAMIASSMVSSEVRLNSPEFLMRQIDHVLLLAATGRPVLPGEEAALTDPEDATHPADREAGLLCIDEGELHP